MRNIRVISLIVLLICTIFTDQCMHQSDAPMGLCNTPGGSYVQDFHLDVTIGLACDTLEEPYVQDFHFFPQNGKITWEIMLKTFRKGVKKISKKTKLSENTLLETLSFDMVYYA